MLAKTRITIIALVAAASFTGAVPAVSQAKPISVHPTDDNASRFRQNQCGRWGGTLNQDLDNIKTTSDKVGRQQATQKFSDDVNKAMDEGCFVIFA